MASFSASLQAFADATGERIEAVVRRVAFEAFSAVIYKSPVDSGRFRASWVFASGEPDTRTVPGGVEKASADVQAARALAAPVGKTMYLTNNLPYATRLEYGWSKQAPAGMVRLTAAEFQATVDRVVSQLRK